MNKENALANLYNASRLAKLSAEEHQVCLESAKVLQEAITPKPVEKSETTGTK